LSIKQPKPEFSVYCAMCGTTFAATADTLKELVQLVGVHLKLEAHTEYVNNNPAEESNVANLRKHHDNAEEILASNKFVWSIDRLSPFTKRIREISKIPPFPPLEPHMPAR
jgi:hypothetical protein